MGRSETFEMVVPRPFCTDFYCMKHGLFLKDFNCDETWGEFPLKMGRSWTELGQTLNALHAL